MNSRNDEIGIDLTNEEVDDAINFGMAFDDMQNELQDNTLPTLNVMTDQGSLGTCSPSPSFDETGSMTSSGSKRGRSDFIGDDTEEQKPKRRVSTNNMGSWNAKGGGRDTTLTAVRLDREREGRCPDCGLETHSIVRSEKGYEKTPLNVEGEVLNGRCLFCHPLEEGESKKNGKVGDASKVSSGQKVNHFDTDVITPQQQNRRNLVQNAQTPTNTPAQHRKTPRKHSWKEHVKMVGGKDDSGQILQNASSLSKDFSQSQSFTDAPEVDDGSSSQYSRNSQISDGMSRLGKAMAAGMGMSCVEATPNQNMMQRQNSKSPHPSRRSPKTRDPPSSTTTPISNSPGNAASNNNSPLGGSSRGDEDVPAHVRLAHNKLPSSIYHHHLFPMSKETEQAYIEKTLAYLESGGGDIVDVIVAMRRFPFSLPIQSLCCEKLYVHCFDNDHAHAIVLVGGIRTVIDAMEHHSKDIALQRGCAGIIKHMATASKYNLDMLDRMGAVRVVVNSMKQNSTCAPLLESCCWALGSMTRGSNPEIKMRVANAGGVHAAMAAVEHFPRNESLLRAAFHCLQQLGYNPSSYTAGQSPQQMDQSAQPQITNQQMSQQMLQRQHLQQLEKVMSQSGGEGNQMQMNQTQQEQFQRMMNQNELQQMNMGQVQQHQLERMMSQSNEMQQMQLTPSQQQQLLVNRQRQQQQMLALSQAGGLPNEEMMNNMIRMNMMGTMGNSQSLLGKNMMSDMVNIGTSQSVLGNNNNPNNNNSMPGKDDGSNPMPGSNNNSRRRM